MAQRTREEIISLILQSASGAEGATRTDLMYKSFLSHDSVNQYIDFLIKEGFLKYLKGDMKFKTTAKGADCLSSLEAKARVCCKHQCKRCAVMYPCGEDSKCPNPFYHGFCQGCQNMWIIERSRNIGI